MPRGVKKQRDFAKEIEEIEFKISRKQEQLEALNAKKSEIEREREQAELHKVYEAMRATGKTPEEVVAMLTASTEPI